MSRENHLAGDDGIRMKYVVSKADGTPVDPDACYFTLRLDDGDFSEAAREAMRTFADHVPNVNLASDIFACLEELERDPCGCREAHCEHEPLFSAVWRHGGEAKPPGGASA